MLATARLVWRLQRFELVVLIGFCIVLAAACAVVAWQLRATTVELEACYRTASDSTEAGWRCRAIDQWANQLSNVATAFVAIATATPFLAGIFLGAPLVAREIERRTAPIAWSLSPSRTSWLARRALPVAGVLLVALLILGQAAEAAILATPPGEIDFRHFAMHGPLIALRGLAVFGISLLVGVLAGRSLPALLSTGLVVAAVFAGLQLGRDELLRSEAVWVDPQESGFSFGYVHQAAFQDDETGLLIGFDEAFEQYPEVFEPDGEQVPPGTRMVYRVNTPDQYPRFVLREAAALAGVTTLVGGVALAAIRTRRPE